MLSTLLNMSLTSKRYSTFAPRRESQKWKCVKIGWDTRRAYSSFVFTNFETETLERGCTISRGSNIESFLSFPFLTMGWLGKWNAAVTMSMSFRDFNLHSGVVNARTCKHDVSKRRGKCLNNCNSNTVSARARFIQRERILSFGTQD